MPKQSLTSDKKEMKLSFEVQNLPLLMRVNFMYLFLNSLSSNTDSEFKLEKREFMFYS